MLIMNKNKVVARAEYNKLGLPIAVKAVPDARKEELPYGLFSPFINGGIREVTYADFLEWVSERCFPENRVDARKLLDEMGLDEYDPLDIVMITNARMFIDDFWVNWEAK